MKVFAFHARSGNFGDDLNHILWPALFGDLLDNAPRSHLIGIGSILDDRLDLLEGGKVIFGAGVRSVANLPGKRHEIEIRFVRGPISARVLGDGTRWITDPGILADTLVARTSSKSGGIGFMPHYRTAEIVDWKPICDELGLLFIDPRSSTVAVLQQLASCDRLITEAMHGAIIADSLRIPWARVCIYSWRQEGFDVSSLKWLDWGLSVKADITPEFLGPFPLVPKGRWRRPSYWVDKFFVERRVTIELGRLIRATKFRVSPDAEYLAARSSIMGQVEAMRAWLASMPAD